METGTFIIALVALSLVLVLWIVVLYLRFYFLRHIKKLKKCLLSLKENLEAQMKKIDPERIENLEKKMEELEGRFKALEEKRKDDLLRYENLVKGLEKRLTDATKIANRISALAGRIGRALAGREKKPESEQEQKPGKTEVPSSTVPPAEPVSEGPFPETT